MIARLDGADKVSGRALYVDDLPAPRAWHGATVRSQVAHGRLLAIERDPAFDWSRVVVVTARDIPGDNVCALIEDDQPVLADRVVRHVHEPVALVAAPDPELARGAAAAIRLRIEPLPAALTIEESMAGVAQLHGAGNVFKEIRVRKGDVGGAPRGVAHWVEGRYHTGRVEQLYIENQGALAIPQKNGSLAVHVSAQCPYYVQKALERCLGRGPDRVHTIQAVTGGGFGGKEEYPSLVAAHAALLALAAGRPVKLIYDRLEDLAATTKRHPMVATIRAGVDRDGRLIRWQVDAILDGGAYVTLSPVVLSRLAIHAGGPYRCGQVDIHARAIGTNTPPSGAYRGFGVPQICFAVESHLDRIARVVGKDPAEVRRVNLLAPGDSTATSHALGQDVAARDVFESVLRKGDYRARRRAAAAFNRRSRTHRRGVGLSCWFHGAGFTGSGEVYLASKVALRVGRDGRVRIATANTEIGQGTRTVFPQLVARALGVLLADVELEVPDTAKVPDSGPTVASRTVMVVGGLLVRASEQLRARVLAEVARRHRLEPAALTVRGGWVQRGRRRLARFRSVAQALARRRGGCEVHCQYQVPPQVVWDERSYRGAAYATYGWAACLAEVEIELGTCIPKVLKLVTAEDIGTVIHPLLASGQVEGGTVQALGYALLEEVIMRDGSMANAQLTNYLIPTPLDTPPIEVIFRPHPYAGGPFGAKGMGELPIDGPAPAITNAIAAALGIEVGELPATPERLWGWVEAARAPGREQAS